MNQKLFPLAPESVLAAISTYLYGDGQELAARILGSSQAEIIQTEYDNWNGGTYYYCLHIHISPTDFISLGSHGIQFLHDTVPAKLNVFSNSYPNQIIDKISVTPTLAATTQKNYPQSNTLPDAILSCIAQLEKRTPGKYVDDTTISQEIGLEIQDVQDWIDILESDGKVKTANTFDGHSALLTAQGRLSLKHILSTSRVDSNTQKIQSRLNHNSRKVSILFLSADPSDLSRLRLGKEFREIQEKLQKAKLREQFKLELPQLSVRAADISQALLDLQPQIVHFSGHGAADGALCFENQRGEAHLISPTALASLFKQFMTGIDCVLLNACYSEVQAKAIAQYIDFVIGMNQTTTDNAALSFTVGFYQALGGGRSIEEAYELGCVQTMLEGFSDDFRPVLIKKSK
jgi:hypothetical protein